MTPLPRDQWRIERCGSSHVVVGMHTNCGAVFWTKMALSDLPNDLVGLDDLVGAVAEPIDVPAV